MAPEQGWASTNFGRWHNAEGNLAILLIPLATQGRLIGVLQLGFAQPLKPGPGRMALLRVLASQITLAVELTRLAGEARDAALVREREVATQQRFLELSRADQALRTSLAALATAEDESAFLGHSLLQIASHAGADRAYLFVLHPAEPALRLRLAVRD